MSRHSHTPLCGPGCRYRGLYEGTQTSLTDMASKQAVALGRVGRLRSGMITTLKRNFGRQFSDAERQLGGRLSDLDDEILLTYLGSFLQLAALTPEEPAGLDALRGALLAAGYTLPTGGDLTTWAECVRAQTNVTPVENLDDLFAEEGPAFRVDEAADEQPKQAPASSASQRRRLTPPENPALPPAKEKEKEAVEAAKPSSRSEDATKSSRRKGKKRRAGEQPTITPNTDDLSELFGPEPGEAGWAGVPDPYDDIPLPEEPDEDPYEPPYDLYEGEVHGGGDDEFTRLYAEAPEEAGDEGAEEDAQPERSPGSPAPAAAATGSPTQEEADSPEAIAPVQAPGSPAAQPQQPSDAEEAPRRSLRPRPVRPAAETDPETDTSSDLADLFGEAGETEEEAPARDEERTVLVAPTRTRRRTESLTPQLPGTETAAVEAPKRRSTKAAAKAVAKAAPEPETVETAGPQRDEAGDEPTEATPPAAPAPDSEKEQPAAEPVRSRTTMGLPLRPEVFLPSPAPKTRSRRGAPAKVVRASALPPDAQIFDVPPETQSEAAPGELTDEIRSKLLSNVCIPRPVFYQDLLAVAGSSEILAAWESENRESNDSPVRFIPPKARHRARGSLVLPYDYHRTAATEFSRSIWAECMKRYRGAKLYELGVLIHRLDAEIVGHRLGEHTVLLRLNQPRGLVGVSVVIDTTLEADEPTRNALVADVSELLSERLTLVAVLVTNAETLEATIQALTDEAGRRKWDPAMPVIAAKSWEYAEDKGSSSVLVIGG